MAQRPRLRPAREEAAGDARARGARRHSREARAAHGLLRHIERRARALREPRRLVRLALPQRQTQRPQRRPDTAQLLLILRRTMQIARRAGSPRRRAERLGRRLRRVRGARGAASGMDMRGFRKKAVALARPARRRGFRGSRARGRARSRRRRRDWRARLLRRGGAARRGRRVRARGGRRRQAARRLRLHLVPQLVLARAAFRGSLRGADARHDGART